MKEYCRLTDREQNCQCSREPRHDGACWCTDCYISHYYAGETDIPKVMCLKGPDDDRHCSCYRELGHTGSCWCIGCPTAHRFQEAR